ncbi:hypothetical protein G6F68_021610 [Rhizopus microsporus]|nr:hypothetical protein G6F68_021610 [Rhizopus microsporus]
MKRNGFHWSSDVIMPTSGDISWKAGSCWRCASSAVSSARMAGVWASRAAIHGNWLFWKMGRSPTSDAFAMRCRSQSMKRNNTRE